MKITVYIVTTCIPEPGEGPCQPSPFGTMAEAEAWIEEMMRDEWEHSSVEDEEGEPLPYPGNWQDAQERLTEFHSDGSWGRWQLTSHEIRISDEALASDEARQTEADLRSEGAWLDCEGRWCHADYADQWRGETPAEFLQRIRDCKFADTF